jgi:phosphoribosylformylglycinamidine synthase
VSSELVPGEVVEIPVKHGEGQYIATTEQLRRIEGEGLVVFRYVDARGEVTEEANPNGSLDNIAGVRSPAGNVVGLMPHPEHAVDPDVGPTGGQPLIASLLASALAGASA